MDDRLLKELFASFTKKGLVLYRFTINPYGKPWRRPIVYNEVMALKEPVVVKVTGGWESQYDENYREIGIGIINKKEPLLTLEEILAAGPEYLREFLGVMVDKIVDERFNR